MFVCISMFSQLISIIVLPRKYINHLVEKIAVREWLLKNRIKNKFEMK